MKKSKLIFKILHSCLSLGLGVWGLGLGTIAAQDIISTQEGAEIDFSNPREYEIGGITVSGTELLDQQALISISGLSIGEKLAIPGEKISEALKKLWTQKLFSDISVSATKLQGNVIFLDIQVKEQPRLSFFKFNGATKSEADNLREKINLYRGKIVTQNLVKATGNIVKEYYVDKGFLNAEVEVVQQKDTAMQRQVSLVINIKKYRKVKIDKITFHNNLELSSGILRRAMEETKERNVFKPFDSLEYFLADAVKHTWKGQYELLPEKAVSHFRERLKLNIFKTSKFLDENYTKDKQAIIARYNSKGLRDSRILNDTVYRSGNNTISIDITVDEGKKYYFRNISWAGNTKYSSKTLSAILDIDKGDIFNQSIIDSRLFMNPNGKDISSLYMDDGYLFFQVTPVEVLVENDSIDLEIRIYEGQQAIINKVTVTGNTKTNDHVIMREIRTRPGHLFSRSDIIRSQRELSQLGYFNPEKLNVNPHPNPADGTVDIEYIVEERPSDQIELSGGWGGGRIVGTLGVSFSNFSTRNFFKRQAWAPLPSGDGQRLSVRAQSNGVFYQSYNVSFTEPWLGGRRPNSLSVAGWFTNQTNGESRYKTDSTGAEIPNPNNAYMQTIGLSVSLGRRLTWPDDYFTLLTEVSYQHYTMHQWGFFIMPEGKSTNAFFKTVLSRNSIDQPIFPRSGAQMTLSLQVTPPFSFINNSLLDKNIDYGNPNLLLQDRYRWAEYHKWKFTSAWYTRIVQNLVLYNKVGFGFLGLYNKDIGPAPFERFYLGGSGLTGFALDGREIIALRGYDDLSLAPRTGGTIIGKYTLELRYPFSLNPSATIYGLGFVEAGNTWSTFEQYNPFSVKRSAGAGIRIFLPMFGLLGLDYGFRLDDVPTLPNMQKSQVHFTIGFNLGEL